jgi:hypothetical protein
VFFADEAATKRFQALLAEVQEISARQTALQEQLFTRKP